LLALLGCCFDSVLGFFTASGFAWLSTSFFTGALSFLGFGSVGLASVTGLEGAGVEGAGVEVNALFAPPLVSSAFPVDLFVVRVLFLGLCAEGVSSPLGVSFFGVSIVLTALGLAA